MQGFKKTWFRRFRVEGLDLRVIKGGSPFVWFPAVQLEVSNCLVLLAISTCISISVEISGQPIETLFFFG